MLFINNSFSANHLLGEKGQAASQTWIPKACPVLGSLIVEEKDCPPPGSPAMKEWGSVSPACLPRNCSVMKSPAIVERTYLLLGCPGVEECCAASPVWTPASLDLGKPPQVLWSRRLCGGQPWKRGHKPSVEERGSASLVWFPILPWGVQS